MTDKLDKYNQKRDFEFTPEPSDIEPVSSTGNPIFVVQKHHATTLHYDLRLEYEGVLKSWAVPKEPSFDPKVKRLAVQTEDHPMAYATFEGEIPAKQYGAGSVVIWDQGTWTPEIDPVKGFAKGDLKFTLHGQKLHGSWALVRMGESRQRPGKSEQWLLIKHRDRFATSSDGQPPVPSAQPAPVALSPKSLTGAKRGQLPVDVTPQLASLVEEVPASDDWLLEPKFDGYRLLCRIDNGQAKLLTRRGNDWTDRFPTIAARAAGLPCKQALIDGEAVVYDGKGVTNFQRLQMAIGKLDPGIVLIGFDLLHLDGWDLRASPLIERKELLQQLLTGANGTIRYGEHLVGHGPEFFRHACEVGLEGVMAKRAGDPYREFRTKSWVKVKCHQRDELVVIGFTDPQGSRTGFGALVLGIRDESGEPLRYAGRVGTGFTEESLVELHERLLRLERKTSPIPGLTKKEVGPDVHWVEPELVAEVEYREWTDDGRLRQPSFKGLREDKPAQDVIQEEPVAVTPTKPKPKPVKLTNPEKVLYDEPGVTKQQLADYWVSVAPVALPLLSQRPLSLFRCPNGYDGTCFYQKHVGAGVPEAVQRIEVDIEEEGDPYGMIVDVNSLLALVQIGVLEIHPWGSQADHLEQPDLLVFDLDPSEEIGWGEVVDAAFDVKKKLEELGLVPFAKLTGGKGLHVVVPVIPGPDWKSVKEFCRAFVMDMVRTEPERFIGTMSKEKRVGKIFVDYLRNQRGATAIGPYSSRARAGAPVAMPIDWKELDPKGDAPPAYSVLEAPKLLKRRKKDPWKDFESSRRSLID